MIVIDHQKLKDKLGTIVRSKEGLVTLCPQITDKLIISYRKMVNVNAQIPFNLHNQNLVDPSLSRSTSLSTNRYDFPQNSRRPPGALGLAAAPAHAHLASRGTSMSRSSSTASLTYASRRGSLSPSDSGTNDTDFPNRNTTLNVKLVNKGYGGVTFGNPGSRRGRPKIKAGDGSRVSLDLKHENAEATPNGVESADLGGKGKERALDPSIPNGLDLVPSTVRSPLANDDTASPDDATPPHEYIADSLGVCILFTATFPDTDSHFLPFQLNLSSNDPTPALSKPELDFILSNAGAIALSWD